MLRAKLECPSEDADSDEEDPQNDGDESGQDGQSVDGNEYVGPVLPGGHRFDKKLLCIRYPGNVVNPDKAIETLGGIEDISSVVDTKNRRMELRFRPDDGYCNPACGDRNETVGFLLRVRVKKSRRAKVEASQSDGIERLDKGKNVTKSKSDSCRKNKNQSSANSIADISEHVLKSKSESNEYDQNSEKNTSPTFDRKKYEKLSTDRDYTLPKLKVLGRVDTEFRFTSLCDFQYLPITKNMKDPSKDECIYEKIYPVGLPPIDWMVNEVPYFLPPAAFSRMDSVQQYVPKPEASSSSNADVIGRTRKRRGGLSNFINFNTPHVPTKPPKGIETAIKVKFLQASHVEKMRKLFEHRPIWSKVALRCMTKFSNEQLKVLLPAVAYYFMTGPWRITWVKLGYDPRKDPEARKYQTLDYRMKGMDGLLSNITCKRNYSEYMLRNRNTPNTKPKTTVLMPNSSLQPQKKRKMLDENVYVFRPGIIPPSRQMFYQYCDVHVKEIQDMLGKYSGPQQGTPCHDKLGWLSSNFDDLCREIISKYVRIELRKLMNIPENHPTSLPRKRRTGPSEKTLKKRKKKPIVPVKPIVEQQPPVEMPMVDEDDMMESEGEEWEGENGLDEVQPNFSDNEIEN